jgi:3-deoxy-D-arabino-heptulosonate 7-phosphate (DAHP) synthase
VSLNAQPSLFLGVVTRILYVLEIQDVYSIAAIDLQQIGSYNCRRTADLSATRNHHTGVVLFRDCFATGRQTQGNQN